MWAYLAAYKMPNDDPEALEARVLVDYPVRFDTWVGRGTPPTLRLQRALGTPGGVARWEKALVWSHWVWFAFPHGTVAYLLLRHRDQFPRGAAQIYATFDIGLIGYWAVPTAYRITEEYGKAREKLDPAHKEKRTRNNWGNGPAWTRGAATYWDAHPKK